LNLAGLWTVSGRASDARFVGETGVAAQIAGLVEPVLAELGFRLVRVLVSGPTVQIMAERPERTITVEECAEISRRLSPVLDAHDPVQGQYTLEVSSPGIDRPLTKPEHFQRFLGSKVKVRTEEAIAGRRNFTGTLKDADDEAVALDADGTEVRIPLAGIRRSNLIPDFGGSA